MSAKQTGNVVLTQAQYDALVNRAKSSTLGSAVLLRNKKDESKYTLHGNIRVDRALHDAIGAELDASATDEAQLDFSMNQSRFLKHDRLDAVGENKAPAFWVEDSSDFAVETFSQHVKRDPDSAYNMFAPPGDRDVSEGAKSRKSA
jgi:hypothetical protein